MGRHPMLLDLNYIAALMAEWELEIVVSTSLDGEIVDALITALYDEDNLMTWRPERAVVAVGEYLTGPAAGAAIVLDHTDIDFGRLKQHVH